MAKFVLPNSYVLTDEEIERRAGEWEKGSWSGHLITMRTGRPRLADEPNANLSFKCPESGADLKKSEFMRVAAIEKAMRVLSTTA